MRSSFPCFAHQNPYFALILKSGSGTPIIYSSWFRRGAVTTQKLIKCSNTFIALSYCLSDQLDIFFTVKCDCLVYQVLFSWSCGKDRMPRWHMSGMWISLKPMNRTGRSSLEQNSNRFVRFYIYVLYPTCIDKSIYYVIIGVSFDIRQR